MSNSIYYIGEYGLDCYGNSSGYCIRRKGETLPVELFPWNIYKPDSRIDALRRAEGRLRSLSQEQESQNIVSPEEN